MIEGNLPRLTLRGHAQCSLHNRKCNCMSEIVNVCQRAWFDLFSPDIVLRFTKICCIRFEWDSRIITASLTGSYARLKLGLNGELS